MDSVCLPPNHWKDCLEAAAHVAEVAIALIATWPLFVKGVWLVRTEPPMSKKEARERALMRIGDRMGWFQRCWTSFLDHVRREPKELLSWKEWRARILWCPISGHSIGAPREAGPAGRRSFVGACGDCRAQIFGTLEDVRKWANSGLSDPLGSGTQVRKRADPSAQLLADAAHKLAEELGRIVAGR